MELQSSDCSWCPPTVTLVDLGHPNFTCYQMSGISEYLSVFPEIKLPYHKAGATCLFLDTEGTIPLQQVTSAHTPLMVSGVFVLCLCLQSGIILTSAHIASNQY